MITCIFNMYRSGYVFLLNMSYTRWWWTTVSLIFRLFLSSSKLFDLLKFTGICHACLYVHNITFRTFIWCRGQNGASCWPISRSFTPKEMHNIFDKCAVHNPRHISCLENYLILHSDTPIINQGRQMRQHILVKIFFKQIKQIIKVIYDFRIVHLICSQYQSEEFFST